MSEEETVRHGKQSASHTDGEKAFDQPAFGINANLPTSGALLSKYIVIVTISFHVHCCHVSDGRQADAMSSNLRV